MDDEYYDEAMEFANDEQDYSYSEVDPALQIHASDDEDLYDPLPGITDAQPVGALVTQDHFNDALYASEVIHMNNMQYAPVQVPPEQQPDKVRSPKKEHHKTSGPSKEKVKRSASPPATKQKAKKAKGHSTPGATQDPKEGHMVFPGLEQLAAKAARILQPTTGTEPGVTPAAPSVAPPPPHDSSNTPQWNEFLQALLNGVKQDKQPQLTLHHFSRAEHADMDHAILEAQHAQIRALAASMRQGVCTADKSSSGSISLIPVPMWKPPPPTEEEERTRAVRREHHLAVSDDDPGIPLTLQTKNQVKGILTQLELKPGAPLARGVQVFKNDFDEALHFGRTLEEELSSHSKELGPADKEQSIEQVLSGKKEPKSAEVKAEAKEEWQHLDNSLQTSLASLKCACALASSAQALEHATQAGQEVFTSISQFQSALEQIFHGLADINTPGTSSKKVRRTLEAVPWGTVPTFFKVLKACTTQLSRSFEQAQKVADYQKAVTEASVDASARAFREQTLHARRRTFRATQGSVNQRPTGDLKRLEYALMHVPIRPHRSIFSGNLQHGKHNWTEATKYRNKVYGTSAASTPVVELLSDPLRTIVDGSKDSYDRAKTSNSKRGGRSGGGGQHHRRQSRPNSRQRRAQAHQGQYRQQSQPQAHNPQQSRGQSRGRNQRRAGASNRGNRGRGGRGGRGGSRGRGRGSGNAQPPANPPANQ